MYSDKFQSIFIHEVLFFICNTKFSDETGKAVTYEDETIFSHIEEWRMNLEQELGVENFLHGRYMKHYSEVISRTNHSVISISPSGGI
jgi:hypothetical protein